MATTTLVTQSAEETIKRGRELGRRLRAPVLVLLSGELGTGKTTLAKGIVAGLGAAREDEVTSPTFTLVHIFGTGPTRDGAGTVARVYHVDLYRIADAQDLESLGLEDAFTTPAVMLVEWPEKLALRTDWPVVKIHLEHAGDADGSERLIEIAETPN